MTMSNKTLTNETERIEGMFILSDLDTNRIDIRNLNKMYNSN